MPSTVETERKYIITKPSLDELISRDGYTVSDITQIYLKGDNRSTHRIRRRAYGSAVQYTETVKLRISGMSAIERERVITESEYIKLSHDIADGSRPIKKTRHTFRYRGFTIEIDVYPEWENTAVLEVELATEEVSPELPSFIRVIREVTGNKAYSNAALSRSFPDEDHL